MSEAPSPLARQACTTLLLAGTALLALSAWAYYAETQADEPPFVVEGTARDVGEVAVGGEREIAFRVHNRSRRELRVSGTEKD